MDFEFFRKNLYFIYSAINFKYKNRKKIKKKSLINIMKMILLTFY